MYSITVLHNPSEFYGTLINGILAAKARIIISCLYLGADEYSMKLIEAIKLSITDISKPNLRVTILVDYSRSLRLEADFKKTLLDLSLFSSRVEVYLSKMPQNKTWFSHHVNEIAGVYHTKYSIFDNNIILSGANLSLEYFVNRQDRYFLLQSKCNDQISKNQSSIVDWFNDFTAVTIPQCYRVNPTASGKILLDPVNSLPNIQLNEKLSKLLINQNYPIILTINEGVYAVPVMQHSMIGLRHEELILPTILQNLSKLSPASVVFSSPYPSYYITLFEFLVGISNSPKASQVTMITASPSSHGFKNGHGFRSLIPYMHQFLSDDCLQSLPTASRQLVTQLEYSRRNWTYHAKGIWIFPQNSRINSNSSSASQVTQLTETDDLNYIRKLLSLSPSIAPAATLPLKAVPFSSITYMGSSNLGSRSWRRDQETGFLFFSRCPQFTESLREECRNIQSHCLQRNATSEGSASMTAAKWQRSKLVELPFNFAVKILSLILKSYL